MQDFPALSELLQIRRDFWAASEVFLMEGIQELGPELAGARDFETFQAEARALLFKDEAILADGTNRDAVDLRLAIAREDALAFQAGAKRTFAEAMEKSRMPTPAELAAIPWGLLKRRRRFARSPLSARRCRGDGAKPGAGDDLERVEGSGRRAAPRAQPHAGPVRRRLRACGRACAPGRPGAEAALRIRAGGAGAARALRGIARPRAGFDRKGQAVPRPARTGAARRAIAGNVRQRLRLGAAEARRRHRLSDRGSAIYAGEDHALGS